jgi:hypothetical protein
MRGIPPAPIIDELKIKTSNGSRFAEHFCLEMTSLVPGRLSAHSGVERENEACLPKPDDFA